MKRVGLVKTCMITALLSSAAWAVPGTQAQAADIPLKAPAAGEAPALWWFHGDVEAGGRFVLNDPQRNGSAYRGQPSLAKYYEYSDVRPGPFGNVWLSTGTSDGLYRIDVIGKNIGYDDQQYRLDASKAGEHYFSFLWDQTPHLYSTSAQTFYQGVGTTSLTLPPGFATCTAGSAANACIAGKFPVAPIDIGINRDTAAADYRWTPTDAWDVKADYSHMHRSGTQYDGVVGFGNSFPYGPTEVPRPVDDVTQNYGLNGEYVGTSPWGQRFNFKLAYNGSTYTDAFTSYTIQDPFTAGAGGAPPVPTARLSTWPSNNANAFSGTLGADLPWNSRYAGTVSYTMMRQNDAFIPMSTQNPGFPLPASSLNGAVNTLLSNNIITTKITPELTSKLSYRYYNFDNQTPQLMFGTPGSTAGWIAYDQATALERTIQSLSMAYIKQNGGADLNWRPTKEWNVGAAYGYERYDYTQVDATSTDENSGKLYADWKPMTWVTFRSSGYYSNRTANNYNYLTNVGMIQFPGSTPAQNGYYYNPSYRQLMIDNRERWKANFAIDMVVARGLTVTPTFKYQDDHYGLTPQLEMGLTDSRSWAGGIDVTYIANTDLAFTFGYEREYATQLLLGESCDLNNVTAYGTNNCVSHSTSSNVGAFTNDRTVVDTFTAAVKYAAIPSKLDLGLRYTLSHGVDTQHLDLSGAPTGAQGASPSCAAPTPAGACQFPDDTTWFQRLDATAVYTFDKEQLARMGWTGVVKAKLHYAWERNSVANWQNDPVAPYNVPIYASGANAIFLASDNPNYNVHLLAASLSYLW
ncbi:MAG TPA: MtrB/PioB family decaheme-associated outer membrane protein [Pseudolabrys sp.]|nr:MtrB/PioB family decaheme-associated outer membrane protein [Pseudolabrys sp.]